MHTNKLPGKCSLEYFLPCRDNRLCRGLGSLSVRCWLCASLLSRAINRLPDTQFVLNAVFCVCGQVKLINPSTSDPVAGDNSDDDSFGESEDDDDDFNGTSMGGGLQRATATVASFGEMLSHSCTLEEEVSQDMFGGEFESNYMTIKSIGKGAFGDVKLAICRSTSQSVSLRRKVFVCDRLLEETMSTVHACQLAGRASQHALHSVLYLFY